MRLLKPIPLTAIVIFWPALVSAAGAAATFNFCTTRPRGANIEHGLALAAGTAFLFGSLLLIFLFVLLLARRDVWSRQWRYLIVGACVLEAAAVAMAIAFVALDSATYVATDCGFIGSSPNDVVHLEWLYYAWGFAIAALLYQAMRVARYSPPSPPPEPEPEVSGLPLD